MLDILRWVVGLSVLMFLLYVPGAVVLNALSLRSPARHLFAGVDEWLFTAALVSFLITGLVSFLLAEVGQFHIWAIVGIVLLISLLVAVTLGGAKLRARPLLSLLKIPPPYPQRVADRKLSRLQQWALLGLVLLACALFARPAEMLRGALDAGAYVNAGVAMARSGSILQRDQLMRELDNDKGEVRELMGNLSLDRFTLGTLRMPAFYVLDKKAALVLPQHYSLYPAWIGLMYSLFGVWGALYTTPLLMLLLVMSVYYFARRALNQGAALVGLFLLIVCPVTFWFARYPVSEVITGLLAFSSFFAFARMVQLANGKGVGTGEQVSIQSGSVGAGPRACPAGIRESASEEGRHGDLPLHSLREQGNTHDTASADSTQERWATFWGVVAGASLGQIALARPDFIFYLAPLPAYLIYWRLSRRWQRPYTWFAASLGALLLLYTVHFVFFSFAYTLDLYHNTIQDVRRLWGPLLLLLYAGVFILVALDRLYPRIKPLWLRAERLAARYRWVWTGLIILGVGAYAIYKYAYAPWQANLRLDKAGVPIAQQIVTTWESYIGAPVDQGSRYNLLRIGWYLSPVGVIIGVAGLLRWIWDRLSAATGLFFGSLLVVGFIFIQETYTEAHYIYTMRRYVPVILPALILGIAWAANFLWLRLKPRQLGALLAGLVIVGLATFFLYTGRVLITHTEEAGALAQLDGLDKQLAGQKSVVLFSNERDEPFVVATPLQYIYGIESFALNRSYPQTNNSVIEGIVKRWQSQGYKVWVMMGANGGKLHLPDYSLKEEGQWEYRVPELEQLYNQKPTNFSESYLPWGIYSVQPKSAAPGWPFRLDIGAMDYPYLVAGFTIQERDNPQSPYWRWTGGQGVLRVPWPTQSGGKSYMGGTVKLRLRPESHIAGQPTYRTQPLTVTVSLDDTPIGKVVIQPGTDFAEYAVQVPPGTPKSDSDPDYALLHIQSPTWSPSEAGVSNDQRALGVQVDAVDIGP